MVLCTKIEIQNNCYSNNPNIINVNTNYVAFVNNDASYAFYNCNAIKNVYALNSNITNMSHAFELTSKNASQYLYGGNLNLPASLQDASYIFRNRVNWMGNDNKVTLPDSVVNAAHAFHGCTNLKGVICNMYNCSNMSYMFSGVTNSSYGPGSFPEYHLSQAVDVDMSYMFYDCRVMQYAKGTLPANVTNMAYTFWNTNLTTDIALSNKIVNMCNCYYRTNITTIPVLPDSVEDISYCFLNCYYVTTATVTIPQNVVNASWAFVDVNNVTTFNFQSQKLVDMSHFTANVYNDPRTKKLQKVEGFLPTTLRNMHNAFLNSPQLTNFCGSNTAVGCVFPDDIEDMSCCFDLCPNLSGNFTLPTNLVNGYQLHYGSSSKVVNYYGTLNKVENIADIFYSGGINRKINLTISLNNLTNSSRAFQSCTGLTADQITFTGASSNIVNAYATFWGDTNLASVPNGFENIKPYTLTFAFGNCSNLFSADFSNMDTSALQYMVNTFLYCYKLNTFNIQINNVPSLNLYNTFAYCNQLRYLNFNISDCPDVIFSNTFYNCQALWRIPNITNSIITSLGAYTFYNCHYLSGFINWNNTNFSNDITSLVNMFANKGYITGIDADFKNSYAITNMDSTFWNCVRLSSFDFSNLPPALTTINSCFYNCTNLSGNLVWNYPNRVTAQSAFRSTKLYSVDIVSNIGSWYNSFAYCGNLHYVNTLPYYASDLQEAFSYCYNLQSVGDFPTVFGNPSSAANKICYYCNNLHTIGNIQSNGYKYQEAFSYCYNLTNVGSVIMDNCSTLNMFAYCNKLTHIDNISLMGNITATGMFSYASAFNSYVNLEGLGSGSNISNMFNGTAYNIPTVLPNLNYQQMWGVFANTAFKTVNCADFVNKQNSFSTFFGTFGNCKSLTDAELTDDIYSYAHTFIYSSIKNVTCPTMTNVYILFNTFSNSSLQRIDLNNSAINSYANAFRNCVGLKTVSNLNFSAITASTGLEGTFSGCNNLTSIGVISTSPNLTSLAGTFWNCQNLTGDFQDIQNLFPNVTNYYSAFQNCSKITIDEVTVPSTVTNLAYTFYGTKIKKLHLEEFAENRNIMSMIYNCHSLTDVTGYINSDITSFTYLTNDARSIVNFTVNFGNAVTNLSNAFCGYVYGSYSIYGYISLQHGPLNFGSVVNMHNTFWNCSNLVSVGNIPNTVTNMYNTFWNCQNLTGDLYIESNQVANATGCFNGTSLPKNVYIPFTYANGEYTQTYNTFYTLYGSGANGVTLLNYTELYE